MQQPAPKWFLLLAILAVVWNLFGCAAIVSDLTLTPEDIKQMTAAQQELYASRPAWAVGASLVAVFGGAIGSVLLTLRKRYAMPVLLASLVGLLAQDLGLFVLSPVANLVPKEAKILQGMVLLIAVGLVGLAQLAKKRKWIAD